MAMTRAEILQWALNLPEQDRLILADELMGSLSDELLEWGDAETFPSPAEERKAPQASWESFLSQLQPVAGGHTSSKAG